MTFRSDIDEASAAIERASAINDRIQTEHLNMIAALNKALVVIGMLAMFGVAFVWSLNEADRQFARQDRHNQENVRHVVSR